MRRRDFLLAVAAAQSSAIILSTRAIGQPSQKRPLLAVLSPQSPSAGALMTDAFRTALADLGLHEGANVWLEVRYGDGDPTRLPGLLQDLLARKPDIIIAGSAPAAVAAYAATKTTPVIMNSIPDPVSLGIAKSIGRPQTNVTGVWTAGGADALLGKRLAVLKELVPNAPKVGAFFASSDPTDRNILRLLPVATAALDLRFQSFEVDNGQQLENALQSAVRDGCGALFISQNPFFFSRRVELASLISQTRLPAIYGFREHVEAGGLISYGSSLAQAYRQMARLAFKVLKGASPAELPIEQADNFELVVNNRTARAIGLKISEAFLARADEVIE